MCVAKAQGESILKPPCCVRQRRGSSEIRKDRASLDESGMNGCHQVRVLMRITLSVGGQIRIEGEHVIVAKDT